MVFVMKLRIIQKQVTGLSKKGEMGSRTNSTVMLSLRTWTHTVGYNCYAAFLWHNGDIHSPAGCATYVQENDKVCVWYGHKLSHSVQTLKQRFLKIPQKQTLNQCNIRYVRQRLGRVMNTHSVLLTQYCAGDKIEKNEMGWACGAYGWGQGGV